MFPVETETGVWSVDYKRLYTKGYHAEPLQTAKSLVFWPGEFDEADRANLIYSLYPFILCQDRQLLGADFGLCGEHFGVTVWLFGHVADSLNASVSELTSTPVDKIFQLKRA